MNNFSLTKSFLAISTLVLTAGCSKGFDAFDTEAKNSRPNLLNQKPSAMGSTKNDAQFAVAVVIEGGTEDDTANLKTLWQARICINKSGNRQSGMVEIDFDKMNIPPYRFSKAIEGASEEHSWDLKSLQLSYDASAVIVPVDSDYDRANYEIQIQPQNVVWAYVGQSPSAGAESVTKELPVQFKLNATSDENVLPKRMTYQANGQKYFIQSRVMEFSRHGNNILTLHDCEKDLVEVSVQSLEKNQPNN